MEIKYKTKYHKTDTISNWKYKGVIYDDWDELYYTYMNTLNCSHCNKEFKKSKDRHLDHNHSTGLFRAIVCQKCNCKDSYINYPEGYDRKIYYKDYSEKNKEKIKGKKKEYKEKCKEKIKEYNKIYSEKNKEKIKEYYEKNKENIAEYKKEYYETNKEIINKKYTCDCGGKYTNRHKKQHLKTIKHIAWFMEQVD